MSFKNDGVLVQEYEYDYAVDGGATGVFTLSSKANKAALDADSKVVVLRVDSHVETAFVGSGASAILGPSADTDKYIALTDVSGFSLNALFAYSTPIVISASNLADCKMTLSGGALTAGKLKVMVQYVHHS